MDQETARYAKKIKEYIFSNYKNNFRESVANLKYPFLVPGASYKHQLWDWDSWLTGLSLLSIDDPSIEEYEKGCVLNFLDAQDKEGRIPILVQDSPSWLFDLKEGTSTNIHKPCLSLHALAISAHYKDVSWIKEGFPKIEKYLSYCETHQRHEETGLYFPLDDLGLGFDNDPTVFYRPLRSTATIYLNSLMQAELKATGSLASLLGLETKAKIYKEKADALANAIHEELFDHRDGFFYSADISLRPVDSNEWLHSGAPRNYHSLPMRIETWAGILPLYSGFATKEEAKRVIEEHYLNPKTLYSKFGIRSLSASEKMYRNISSGNPSCWVGPIWINANYFTYIALKNYGYNDLAEEIAAKTIRMLGKDLEKQGQFSEYYDAETGEGLRNPGFQSWNFLVLPMILDLEE